MFAKCLLVLTSAGLATAALAQSGGINWQRDVSAALNEARRTQRPLMFYIVGPTSDRPDSEKDQRVAFRDPTVVRLSQRFVACRLQRSQHRADLERWQISPNSNLDIVFVTPDGNRIDMISAGAAGNADSFSQKMHLVFDKHRNELFARELQPRLDDPETSVANLRTAIGVIDEFIITRADQALVRLLDRPGLSTQVRADAYKALATLSTSAAVNALFARAATDTAAAQALERCAPAAAEVLLPHVGGDDPAKHLLAYKAVMGICRISGPKPDRFWEGPNERVKADEIERVRSQATRTAERWKRENRYR
jgi:hypothetical protein